MTLVSVLVLVGLGMAIIFGLMDVMNLAHGEFITIGAYTLVVVQKVGGNYWVGLIVAPFIGYIIGIVYERLIIRYLYQRPLDTLIATFGVSLILQKGIEFIFGPGLQNTLPPLQGAISFSGILYPTYRVFMIVFAFSIISLCLFLYKRSQFGLDLRAVIQDRNTAEAMGINTKGTYRVAFAAGSALATIAGVLLAPLISVNVGMGFLFLAKAFFVVILGGVGSIAGVVAGSCVIGGMETSFLYFMDGPAAYALVLIISVVIIRFRPKGLVPV